MFIRVSQMQPGLWTGDSDFTHPKMRELSMVKRREGTVHPLLKEVLKIPPSSLLHLTGSGFLQDLL